MTRKPAFWLITLTMCMQASAFAQSSGFTYQGKLADGGNAANGQYDFQFQLFDALSGGTQQGTMLVVSNVTVTAGIFTVQLDFGVCPTCFNGSPRFLEIAVKPTSGSTFTTLSPRQQVTSTPYAIRSLNATSADGLSVACVNCVTSSQIASVSGSVISGAIPVASVPAGSANYIQNGTSQQAASNFNISGNGTAGGTLSANAVNATTQYNLGTNRVLSTSSGGTNLIVGVGAGGVATGSFNTFVGTSAGANTTISGANSFFGYQAGLANINGGANAFFGYQTGVNNSGASNSFFGTQAGSNNTSGGGNAFFGLAAGGGNTTGNANTLIGNQADVGANNLTNATAIGYRAQVSQSNALVLGPINGVNSCDPGTLCNSVNVGIGTTAPAFKLHVIDASNTGVRVETVSTGGTVASFGGAGDFQIDAAGVVAGRFVVKESGNVGIGTNNPQSKLHVQGAARVTGGNLFIAQPNSLIITSPNGSCWQIRVSDVGALTAASVACP